MAATTCLRSVRPQAVSLLPTTQHVGQNKVVLLSSRPASGLPELTLRRVAAPVRKIRSQRLTVSASVSGTVAAAEGVQYVDPEQAKKLVVEEGYTILDVRDNSQFERSYISTSVHVPLYIDNNDLDPGSLVNRVLHNGFAGMLFGIPYLKQNDKFVSEVQTKAGKDSKLVVVCQQGMRSGTAVKILESAGYQDLAYLALGLDSVQPGIFEKSGNRELKDAGKAGLYSVQGPLTIALFCLLSTAYLFIQFFPTQAFEWFGWSA